MIIVRLCGGLGNQMFQYATARRVALVNEAALKLDLSWFGNIPPGDTHRRYEMHVFNSAQDVASAKEVQALRGVDITRWPKLAKRFLDSTGLLVRQSWIKEKDHFFDPEILNLRGDAYLEGFWQSARYFDDVAETIRRDFTIRTAPDFENRKLAGLIQRSEAVSVHVRRGDYVANPITAEHHGVSPLEYYQAAMAEISSSVSNPHAFLFSDDPGWVKNNLTFEMPMTCIDHNGPDRGYEDLRLMSLCKHHIIANSSFSWWGAWLNKNAAKIVIAPRQWFNNPDFCLDDLLPPAWLRI